MDFKEQMQLARQNAIAKHLADRRAAESASREVSSIPPSPSISAPNQMLPLRETVTEPTASQSEVEIEPISPPKSSHDDDDDDDDETALPLLPLGTNEYVVPLPMQSQTRDIYVMALRNRKHQRKEFLHDEVSDSSLIREIDLMIDELGKLCDHADLIVDDFSTQRAESSEVQAKHAETISTKCIFVAEFLDYLRSIDAVHVYGQQFAILAKPGRIQEILKSILIFHGFEQGPDGSDLFTDDSGGPLKIYLRSTTEQYATAQSTSAIIAFDSPLACRPYSQSTGALISLVVTHSVEHIELCLDSTMEDQMERKKFLVDFISQTQEDAGKLGADYPSPPDAARLVARFLMDSSSSTWPIPPMPEITGLEFGQPSQTQSTTNHISGSTQSHDTSTLAPQPSTKRLLVSFVSPHCWIPLSNIGAGR